MYAYIIIAGIALIVMFLWMSNSIRNRTMVKSASVGDFIKKFAHRHMIAIPLILMMLVIIPIFTGVVGLLLDAAFVAAEVFRCYKIIDHCQQQHEYVKSITPDYQCYYARIHLTAHDNYKLGGHDLHYMFICPKTGLITFPESKYGNRRKYRLIEVHFRPKYGPNYLRLTYNAKDCTRRSLFKNNAIEAAHRDKIAEIPSVATVILESRNENRPIIIRLHEEVHNKIRKLKRNCLVRLKHHQDLSNGVA